MGLQRGAFVSRLARVVPPTFLRYSASLVFTNIYRLDGTVQDTHDGYAALLADHRRVIRNAIARHDGAEVDRQGDAFFIAFARASDAVGGSAGGGVRDGASRSGRRCGAESTPANRC